MLMRTPGISMVVNNEEECSSKIGQEYVLTITVEGAFFGDPTEAPATRWELESSTLEMYSGSDAVELDRKEMGERKFYLATFEMDALQEGKSSVELKVRAYAQRGSISVTVSIGRRVYRRLSVAFFVSEDIVFREVPKPTVIMPVGARRWRQTR